MKRVVILIASLLLAGALAAQDDTALSELIEYDLPVSDSLTERAFWDWWRIQADEGDVIVAEMQAGETLAPLLGILGPSGELMARSPDGELGGAVSLEHQVEEVGEYTIVATRAGNENGTTTGSYDLIVRRANPVPLRINPYQEVIFRCQNFDAANVMTMIFQEDPDQSGPLLISVYGLDGFEPVIRVTFENFDLTDCSRDVQVMVNNVYQLPGESPVTLGENIEGTAAQLYIESMAELGQVTLTIGSADGAAGRFIAVLHDFTIGEDDQDSIQIGQGPLASIAPLYLYMIAGQNSRLDPALSLEDSTEETGVCDDAGRRSCEGLPSPLGLFVHIAAQGLDIEADRFDAGIALAPGPPELRQVELASFSDRTTGPYALVMLGELPPRETDGEES